MKKSNTALLGLACTLLAGIIATGFILKEEAIKIDLNDPTRNYLTEHVMAFKVLKISGSNGYPIEIEKSGTNSISVLRRRKSFLEMKTNGDTLEVIFSGANNPIHRADQTTSPAGVIIKSNAVAKILLKDTYNRVKGFEADTLNLQLAGNSFTDFVRCRFSSLFIAAKDNSRVAFKQENTADTITLHMANTTLAHLENINFAYLKHQVGDSATVVFSGKSMAQLEQKVIGK